ncbi:hypothetical protein S7711_06841 [Stachybotrys chartarum IBT 7711]|uniref:NACHT domain-containing protein n=1 Tax=Stachybotrys chartarum (strain CBS 109288 / IBT 7711) TaxID=1280523 RepID=A0A084B793_STACB|nr:hypothetical protein S7711_06841 [Stachybotrys chartarum IBT 7711]
MTSQEATTMSIAPSNATPTSERPSTGPILEGNLPVDSDSSKSPPAAKAPAVKADQIKPQDLGLKTYRVPMEGHDTEIDIVAVHGLGVNPKTTWIHGVSKRNWLEDLNMLPSRLPDARIMSYCYDSQWIGDQAVRSSLEGVATKLLRSLGHERMECPNRPIIFIGHCLGGLVMQQAYLSLQLHPGDWSNISTSNVNGMVFLGTPHHGVADGTFSTQGQIYQHILAKNSHVETNILHSVERNNDVLKSVVHNFTRCIHNTPNCPDIFCFYEQRATKVGAIAGLNTAPTYLVDETSGTLSGHQKEELPLDHFCMNKFEDEYDSNYQSVAREIDRMAQKAVKMRAKDASSAAAKRNRDRSIPTLPAPIAAEDRFAPRDGLLDRISRRFESSGRVALYGQAGTGKTHIALEYAYRYRREHPASHILWVNAGSAEQFECSYKRIAVDRGLVRDDMDLGMVVEAVRKFLRYESSGHWLMILDGFEDETDLMATGAEHAGRSLLDFIPNSVHSSVLITSQSKGLSLRQVGQLSENSIEMPSLSEKDASILLFGRITENADRKRWIQGMMRVLDNLPIGLVLAHIYQKEVASSMKSRDVLKAIEAHSGEKRPAARAWNLLMDLMRKQHSDSVNLMLLMGIFDLQSVPGTLLDRPQIAKQVPVLVRYGIVEPSTDKRLYHITSTIRACVRDWLAKHQDEKLAIEELALSTMCERFTPETSEGLLPCALALIRLEPRSPLGQEKLIQLCLQVSDQLAQLRRFPQALLCLQICHAILEKSFSIKNRDELLTKTTKDIENIKQISKKKIGTVSPDHRTRDMARVKAEVDKLAASKDHGKDHKLTISRTSDLAAMQLLRPETRGSDSTVDLYQRVLDWHQARRTADHMGKARHQYNLALAHESKGDFNKAEKLYHSAIGDCLKEQTRESLVLRFRILGNLVCSYGRQGRLDVTEEVLQTLLPEQTEMLGWDHPDTLVTRHSAALLLQERGSIVAAEDELRRILDAQRSLLDSDDAAMFRTACSLALNLRLQKRHLEAENLFQETLKTQQQVLGMDHVDTTRTSLMLKELLQDKA